MKFLCRMLLIFSLCVHPLVAQQGITHSWQEAYALRDEARMAMLYTPQAVLDTADGRQLSGDTSIALYWREQLQIPNRLTYLTDVRTVVIGDHAVVTGQYLSTDQDGVLQKVGNFSQIWTLQQGEWLIHRERWLEE